MKTVTVLKHALCRWQRRFARACGWLRDVAVIADRRRGVSPVVDEANPRPRSHRLLKANRFLLAMVLVSAWMHSDLPRLIGLPSAVSEARAAIIQASASADATLSATSYTLMDSMTLTPGAGNYLAVFSSGVLYPATAPGTFVRVSIFVNGVQQPHTEREIFAETSLDSARVPIVTHAHISVAAGETVEVRYLRTGATNFTAKNRTLTLFPVAPANVSQATATADDTLNSATYTLLPSMTLTPGAGDYLLTFSTSADGVSGSILNFAVFVNGTIVPHTERTGTQESSIPNTEMAYLIAAKVSPGAGQAVEIRWRNSGTAGNIVAHERTLTLVKVNSSDIFEATATADSTSTSTTDVLVPGMTLTPGAGEYLGLFSASDFYGTIGANSGTLYSFHVNGVKDAASERDFMHEASVDDADMAVFINGRLNAAAAQAVEVRWRGDTTTTRTIRERSFVLLREAVVPATLSSAANQSFTVGQASTTASVVTVTDSPSPTITTTNEIRIRIPAGFNMTWDPTVTTITRGGSASAKVSATLLAYEDSNRTAVVDVTTNFAASDVLTITGLKFTNFSAVSAASNLQLVVAGSGGATADEDDKTITIGAGATLSSAANQSFTVGQASTTASVLTVTEAASVTITSANEIRIRIPAGFNMTWDPTVTTVTLGGTASAKVSPTLMAYEDGNRTVVLNVTSNFTAGQTLTITGLKFANFTAASAADNLELVTAGTGQANADEDDKTITIVAAGAITAEQSISACVAPGAGAIVFDAASFQDGGTTAVGSLTWSHTVTSAGSDRILIVGVSVDHNHNGPETVTGVTYGGVSMTLVPGGTATEAGFTRSELWYLTNPPTGANNAVVTLSGNAELRAGATSYTGVDQTTPLGTANGAISGGSSSSPATVNVSSAAGELVVDNVAAESTSSLLTVGAGQTSRYLSDTGSTNARLGGSTEPGAATVTMSWTIVSPKQWAIVAVPLKPAAAAPVTSLTLPSWTPQAGELLLVGIVMRDETITHSVSGNGLTWTLIADRDNDRGQMGVALYRASGPAPTAGSITITLTGNTDPVYAAAVRLSGVDTTVNQGIEALATASGPAGTDDANMKVTVTTVTANAMALAWGGQRGSATLSVPAPETIIVQSGADCGTSGDRVRGHMWREIVATPGPTVLGQDNSLSAAVPWAVIAVSIKPLPGGGPTPPGAFNVFETSTAAAAITGVIKTRVAGGAFSLDVVAISGGAQDAGFTDPVTVELLGNNTLGVSLDANNCPTTSTLVQTVSPNPTITAGRSTVNFAAVANSWRDVRARVRWPASSPTVTSCSTDNFAIRPDQFASYSMTDGDWETAGTTRTLNNLAVPGGTVHKAGRPFTVRATAVNGAGTPATTTNYVYTPTVILSVCAGSACTASFGTFNLGASFAAGQLTANTATYSEVGAFRVQIRDDTFSNVDAADSTTGERRIQSSNIDVGRFVPDHFAVSLNAPLFGTACSGFTYIGQAFNYTTAPVITVTAQNFTNGTTANYAGALWQITNASLAPGTQAARYSAAGAAALDVGALPATSLDPAIAVSGNGVGTLTFSSTGGIAFSRAAPVPPFNADIALAVDVIDADNAAFAGNPAKFGDASAGNGIAFSAGKAVRFGRLRLQNAYGPESQALPVPLETQYWNGSGFVRNTDDSCTTLNREHIALSGYTLGLNACETAVNEASMAFSGGQASLTLAAAGTGNAGRVLLTPVLGAAGAEMYCPAKGGAETGVTSAARAYLQGRWTGAAWDENPSGQAAFGLYGSQPKNFIFFRENY